MKREKRGSLGTAIFLAIILAATACSVISTVVSAAVVSLPEAKMLDQISSAKDVQPLGDPIDGGPPGAWSVGNNGI